MAAAQTAAQSDNTVLIVDDNPALGGQIWRGEHNASGPSPSRSWFTKVHSSAIQFLPGARVVSQPEVGLLVAEPANGSYELRFRKLILATGAREQFLPFPGWTLPNVMGAGGLQALVKGGLPIAGKRVVVAGSGPLLLAVGAYLKKQGAEVLLIAEQAAFFNLSRFTLGLLADYSRAKQAFQLNRSLRRVPYHLSCWVVAAEGNNKLESVRLQQGRMVWDVACDYLACGYHLVPNLELPMLLGCKVQQGSVCVDEFQQTSLAGIYAAGESTGIGGLDLSLIEGQIAGLAAVGMSDEARRLFRSRARLQRFANLLNRTFALRDELKRLPTAETIVCRCEDVTFARLQAFDSWRAAKLQTRCGMGPCQGRICGPATEFLFDWQVESVRPPIFPARLDSLIRVSESEGLVA
jgi:NADPH-dependent 2,4-dienoyl-CoA reductase/sulfur reductase-like enzyme